MNIGVVLEKLSNFEKALFHHGKAQEVFVAVYGWHHPEVADTLLNTGIVYHKQGKIAEAKEMYARAYKIRLEKLGPNHPQTLKLKRFA